MLVNLLNAALWEILLSKRGLVLGLLKFLRLFIRSFIVTKKPVKTHLGRRFHANLTGLEQKLLVRRGPSTHGQFADRHRFSLEFGHALDNKPPCQTLFRFNLGFNGSGEAVVAIASKVGLESFRSLSKSMQIRKEELKTHWGNK